MYLSIAELEQYNISLDDIGMDTAFSKQFLSEIIAIASASTQFEPQSENYTIEVFAQKSGCILYISSYSAKRYKHKQSDMLICRVNDAFDLFSLCTALEKHAEKITQSVLFTDKSGIYLILKASNSDKDTLLQILREFGDIHSSCAYQLSNAIERNCIIFENDAVKRINSMIKT